MPLLKTRPEYPFDNIIHCCTQKTGSQWFKSFFRDKDIDRLLKLKFVTFSDHYKEYFDSFKEIDDISSFTHKAYADTIKAPQMEKGILGINFYIGYEEFKRLMTSHNYKCFFIMRDPRDILVSGYFSRLYSHTPNLSIAKSRELLQKMNEQEGIKHIIDIYHEEGIFKGQQAWADKQLDNTKEKIFYYEDFSLKYSEFMHELIDYLEIPLKSRILDKLIDKYSFTKFTHGRKKGETDNKSHYRSGVPGDWKKYFDEGVKEYFINKTGLHVEKLGYYWD